MTMIYRSAGTALSNNEIDSNFKTVEGRYIGSSLASAATLTLTNEYNYFVISGNTNITKITDVLNGAGAYGYKAVFRFESTGGAIGHATQILMPGETTHTWGAGDVGVFVCESANVWRCISYQSAAVAISELDYLEGLTANIQNQLDNKNQNFQVNGGMPVWQRGTTVTDAAQGSYTADQFGLFWVTAAATGKVNWSRSALVPTLATDSYDGDVLDYSLKVDVNTQSGAAAASDYLAISSDIVGYDYAKFAGGTITLTGWVRSNTTGIYSCVVSTGSNDRAYGFEYTIAVADTWQKVTFPIDLAVGETAGTWATDNTSGLRIRWALQAGTNLNDITSGSWVSTDERATSGQSDWWNVASADFHLAGVKLEEGSNSSKFTSAGATYADELALCERNFCKSFSQGVTPAQNIASNVGAAAAVGSSTGRTMLVSDFPVTMNATPTIVKFNPNAANDSARNDTDSTDVVVTATPSDRGISFVSGVTAGDANDEIYIHWTAEAKLQ